jgi:hypothetical protein
MVYSRYPNRRTGKEIVMGDKSPKNIQKSNKQKDAKKAPKTK